MRPIVRWAWKRRDPSVGCFLLDLVVWIWLVGGFDNGGDGEDVEDDDDDDDDVDAEEDIAEDSSPDETGGGVREKYASCSFGLVLDFIILVFCFV